MDGREWVKVVNGVPYPVWANGKWTSHASSDQMRAGISLRASSTGLKQFNKLVNSKIPIQVVVNTTDNNKDGYGNNDTPIAVYTDGSAEATKSTITIYEKETNEYAAKTNVSEESSLAGTFGHEIEHTTDENTQLVSDYEKERNKNKDKPEIPEVDRTYEQEPRRIKDEIINEMNK